jgi:hypothetical protein
VWKILEKLIAAKPVPLTGAPAVRRQKSYSGLSGYVYQYYYEGQRPAQRDGQPGLEFVFNVSADRKTTFPVSVWLAESSVESWEQQHGRQVYPNERYAIAKLALFGAFDERENPERLRDEIRVGADEVAKNLETLEIE